ncbi:MAG: Crp/Fnr family transcriptional regulator [Oscillospiraceae bacterium]|nr:Crp/Fnr family transcriptional regulator [Oscillospiraceae bacterium]
MPDFKCAELFGKYFPFWEKLNNDQRELLCRHTTYAVYENGQNIHGASGECTGVILIKSGQARSYMLSEDGKEITLYRLFPGDICMLSSSCILRTITFDVFVDAEVKSEVYIISSQVMAQLADECVYVENFALRVATERFSDVMWAMQQILFMSMDKRLAVFLIDELSKKSGNDSSPDTVDLTQEQIARYMGSAREVVSRMLKYFSSEKLVEVSRGGVKIIDKERLRKMAL